MNRTMNLAMIGRSKARQGFVLIETVVAFTVLSIGFASIGVSIAVALQSDAKLETRRIAMQIARARLECAGIVSPLVPGSRSGGDGSRTWSETVTRVATALDATGGNPAGPGLPKAFWVEIAVATGDGGKVRLAGLKFDEPVRP